MQSSSALGPLGTGNLAKNLLAREATGIRVKTPHSAWSGDGAVGGTGGGGGGECPFIRPETSERGGGGSQYSATIPTRGRSSKRATVSIDLSATRAGGGRSKVLEGAEVRSGSATRGQGSSRGSRRGPLTGSAGGGEAVVAGVGKREKTHKTEIKVVTYTSKSASRTLDRPTSCVRPVRRHIRIHIISDKERAQNLRADALGSDIAVPRAWQASQALQKAQRQNRTHERHLGDQLDTLDKGLVAQFNRINTYERRLVSEFLGKYPAMYDNVMAGLRDDKVALRRIGIFPAPSAARDGSFRRMTEAAMQEAEAAIIRTQMRTPGGGQFPPLARRKVQITAYTAAGSSDVNPHGVYRVKGAREHNLRSRSSPGGILLEGVKCQDGSPSPNVSPPKETEKKTEKSDAADGSEFSIGRSRSFILTPGTGSVAGSRTAPEQSMNVSQYVETDFGFQPDRVRRTVAGMSLQKDIQDKTQLENDIRNVAHKHIDAITTSGLNGRASRKVEGAHNLRAVIVGGKRSLLPAEQEAGGSRRTTPSGRDDVSITGSTVSTRGARSTSTKIVVTPRRPKLKAGGALPPLDKDPMMINVVGKADGDLVSQVNVAASQSIDFDYDFLR